MLGACGADMQASVSSLYVDVVAIRSSVITTRNYTTSFGLSWHRNARVRQKKLYMNFFSSTPCLLLGIRRLAVLLILNFKQN